jgi:2-oxoglutarate ferredoxin oxidoreductase subunit beta
MGKAVDNMMWIKENTLDVKQAAKMSEEELEGKLLTGILADKEKAEYTELYEGLVRQLREEGGVPELPEREPVAAWTAQRGGMER